MKKKNFLDSFLFNLIDEHLEKISLGILVLLALVIRFMLMPDTDLSPDYNTYYLDWVNQYREYGIITGLGKNIGDYYVPYNIMYAICSLFSCEPYVPITIFSTIAEFVTAFYIVKIIKHLAVNSDNAALADKRAWFVGVGSLFLPFVVFNGALWKQCDAIYVVFMVIALYHILKENYRLAFVFLAISFSFKLQAIFIVPLFIVVYMIKKGFSILEFLWVPVMYLVMGLPSVLCRKGLRDTYFAYLSQTNEVQTEGYGMVSYYPNIYNFGLDDFDELLKTPAIMLVAGLMVIIAVFAYNHRDYFEKDINLLVIGSFMAWTMCMFLPGMHERYDYVIVLLMTVLSLSVKKELLPIAIIMNISSLLVYIIVLFGYKGIPITIISAVELAAYIYMAVHLFGEATTAKLSK